MARRQLVRIGAVLLALGGVAACGGGEGAEDATGAAAGVGGEVPSGEGIGVDRPVITATGVGRASGAPDAMVVSLNVHSEGATAAETMDVTSLVTTQLQATVATQGVAPEDLQTTNVAVYPRFDSNGRRVVGYSADNSFTVRYTDLATAGAHLDELVGLGGDALQIHGVALEIDDPTGVLAEARADAVARAAEQAAQLAAAAGVELGAVRTIAEVAPGIEDGFDQGRAAAGAAFDESLQVAVPVASGSQEVVVQVRVVYDLGPATGD